MTGKRLFVRYPVRCGMPDDVPCMGPHTHAHAQRVTPALPKKSNTRQATHVVQGVVELEQVLNQALHQSVAAVDVAVGAKVHGHVAKLAHTTERVDPAAVQGRKRQQRLVCASGWEELLRTKRKALTHLNYFKIIFVSVSACSRRKILPAGQPHRPPTRLVASNTQTDGGAEKPDSMR